MEREGVLILFIVSSRPSPLFEEVLEWSGDPLEPAEKEVRWSERRKWMMLTAAKIASGTKVYKFLGGSAEWREMETEAKEEAGAR